MIPDFHYSYDDYLQYAPAAVMVGMKAFGYQIKAFAELGSMDLDKTQPWLSTLVVGFGTGWFL